MGSHHWQDATTGDAISRDTARSSAMASTNCPSRPGKPLTVAVRGTHSSSTRVDVGLDEQSLNAAAHNGVEIVQKLSRDGFGGSVIRETQT